MYEIGNIPFVDKNCIKIKIDSEEMRNGIIAYSDGSHLRNLFNRLKNLTCRKNIEVPIWEKVNLTLDEASALFGIGINKLRVLSDSKKADFVLWNGAKRLIKRKKFEEFLDKSYSI